MAGAPWKDLSVAAVIDEQALSCFPLLRGLREKGGSHCHCWRTGSRQEMRNVDDEPQCRPAALHLRHSPENSKYFELQQRINIFLSQPIPGVGGGGVTRGEKINSHAWTWSFFHTLYFVWKSPLFFYSQIYFGFSHLSHFTHSYFCQLILAIVKTF